MKKKKPKSGLIRIYVDYGRDPVDFIEIAGKTFVSILRGKQITLRGNPVKDDLISAEVSWGFNFPDKGSVSISTDMDLLYSGSIYDPEVDAEIQILESYWHQLQLEKNPSSKEMHNEPVAYMTFTGGPVARLLSHSAEMQQRRQGKEADKKQELLSDNEDK
jgi:hypothetical protein